VIWSRKLSSLRNNEHSRINVTCLLKYYASVLDVTLESSRFKWNARNLNSVDRILDTREGLMSGNIFAARHLWLIRARWNARGETSFARKYRATRDRATGRTTQFLFLSHIRTVRTIAQHTEACRTRSRDQARARTVYACVRAHVDARGSRVSLFFRVWERKLISREIRNCDPSDRRDGAKNVNLRIRILPRA